MSTLAIIPARSGSQGLPDKNIRKFCGTSLVERAIKTALSAQFVDRVVVSTDSEHYARICRAAGAEVIMRPPELSTGTASSESALLHVLEKLRAGSDAMPDWIVFQQCTSPFTRPDDIDALLHKARTSSSDSGFTAVKSHRFIWRENEAGEAVGLNHQKTIRLRRQDREPEFAENGAVYVMRTEGFLLHKHRFFGKTIIHELPDHHGIEIDSEEDWQIAETIFTRMRLGNTPVKLPSDPKLVVFDFDGVLTDNRVLVTQDGTEAVLCDRADGMAIEWLKAAGIPGLILSKERNPVVEMRARKLGIPAAQAIDNKAAFLTQWCLKHGIELSKVVYVGNDLNDLECFRIVGCSVAVRDAAPEILEAANVILSRAGGNGAVRELIEKILAHASGHKKTQSA